MPSIVVKRGNLMEHDSWNRHKLAHDMGLWDFSYAYAVNTMDIDQTIDGVKTFLNFPVTPVGFPIEDNQAANKFYVDYMSRSSVTFENLFSNGDVGTGANQVAIGNHSHDNLPDDDQKGAMDTAQNPNAGNPFVTYNQFAVHSSRHENNGPDEISLNGLSGGPVTINGLIVKVTEVSSTPYSILNTDVYVSVDTSVLSITLNLPAITSDNHGQKYIIKDKSNNAGDKNIIIVPSGINQVGNGGASVSFSLISDSEAVSILANNTTKNWEIPSLDKGKFKIVELNSTTTLSFILADEIIVLCDTDGGPFTVNLPALVDVRDNIVYSILNKGSSGNGIIIDGNSSETIDGELTQEIPDASSVRIIPTQNGWFIL